MGSMARAERVPFRALGVWRSLVARSVRVGEVPSSNLGTPIARRTGNPALRGSLSAAIPEARGGLQPSGEPPLLLRIGRRGRDAVGRAAYPRSDAARGALRRRLHPL